MSLSMEIYEIWTMYSKNNNDNCLKTWKNKLTQAENQKTKAQAADELQEWDLPASSREKSLGHLIQRAESHSFTGWRRASGR